MDVRGITIDRHGTRDRNGAVWADLDARGWTVTVCIANVAAAISKGSTFDVTAHRRVQAQCHGSRSTPLLPRRFSEGSCSLTSGQPRAVLAVRIRLDHELEVQFLTMDDSTLVSETHLEYDQVSRILESPDARFHTPIKKLAKLADGLLKKRQHYGAFAFQDLGRGLVSDEEGYLHQMDPCEALGYVLVQELMILVNAELARFCAENNIPVLYRNHVARPSAPERDSLLERIGLGLGEDVASLSVAKEQLSLVLSRPRYGTTIEGHYGLRVPAYVHGTSPIRRFADLVVQRQLLAHVYGRPLPYNRSEIQSVAEHINRTLEERDRKEAQSILERSDRRLKDSLQHGGLPQLSNGEFERVLKKSIQSEKADERIIKAFERRVQNGRAGVIELYLALIKTSEPWKRLRQVALAHLTKHPPMAVSVAAVAGQKDGWGTPSYKTHRRGDGEKIIHEVQVEFSKRGFRSGPISSTNLRLAKQRAVVEALAIAVGEPRPQWGLSGEVELWEMGQPIHSLYEHCAQVGADPPAYSITRSGAPGRAPIFIANCRALNFSVDSTPQASKKTAKRQAASKILDLIRAGAKE